ncbi:hypothetical protein AACH10_14475 [Ideonella sp. DXS22W]|uniref:HEAT repeat domain-containing protein n=1 Tax=Pseudaquabacterium inlustre TaxID=2984192 RepID=A0ABU9CJV7_9BURK
MRRPRPPLSLLPPLLLCLAYGLPFSTAAADVAPWVARLGDDDSYRRGDAAVALGQVGEAAVPALVQALRSADARVRTSVAIAPAARRSKARCHCCFAPVRASVTRARASSTCNGAWNGSPASRYRPWPRPGCSARWA